MINEFISKNPYEIDYFTVGDDKHKYAALTEKNKDFIHGILRIDSNYSRDMDATEPSKGFEPLKPSNKYCGSAAYWFTQMLKGGDFEECLAGAIMAVDRVNSTHLEASKNGRETIRKRIRNKCRDVKDLKKLLEEDLKTLKGDHILFLLADSIPDRKSGGPRFNLSFASKFCFYAAKWLKAGVEYSKYDGVVSGVLSIYYDSYLEQKSHTTKKTGKNGSLSDRVNVYLGYCAHIEDILDALKKDGRSFTREDFDAIVWYANK